MDLLKFHQGWVSWLIQSNFQGGGANKSGVGTIFGGEINLNNYDCVFEFIPGIDCCRKKLRWPNISANQAFLMFLY